MIALLRRRLGRAGMLLGWAVLGGWAATQTRHQAGVELRDHVTEGSQRVVVLVNRILTARVVRRRAVPVQARLRQEVGTGPLQDAQRAVLQAGPHRGDAQ